MTRKEYEQARKDLMVKAADMPEGPARTTLIAMVLASNLQQVAEQVEYIAEVNEG